MASKRKVRASSCGEKKKFKTFQEAMNACYLIRTGVGEKMRAYKCKYCKYYHIGHFALFH